VTPRPLLGREKLRRVSRRRGRFVPRARPETRRTPGLAAGCNKPARRSVEQTVGVGRNDRGGTHVERGSSTSKAGLRFDREWTRSAETVEGRSLMNLKRGSSDRNQPVRGRGEKSRAIGVSLRKRDSRCQAPDA